MSISIHVKNIKISFHTKSEPNTLREVAKQLVKEKKIFPSFFVYKFSTFTFIIYYTGHINVTGLRLLNDIYLCYTHLVTIPGVSEVHAVKIDNITLSGQVSLKPYRFIPFIKAQAIKSSFDKIRFSQEIFPGAQFKLFNKGTLVLFRSGKFNLVGIKNYSDAIHLTEALIKDLSSFNEKHDTLL